MIVVENWTGLNLNTSIVLLQSSSLYLLRAIDSKHCDSRCIFHGSVESLDIVNQGTFIVKSEKEQSLQLAQINVDDGDLSDFTTVFIETSGQLINVLTDEDRIYTLINNHEHHLLKVFTVNAANKLTFKGEIKLKESLFYHREFVEKFKAARRIINRLLICS